MRIRSLTSPLAALACVAWASIAQAAPPQLAWDTPVRCLRTPEGQLVHVQCDEALRQCLVAPTQGSDGAPLDKLKECAGPAPDGSAYPILEASGLRLVPAVAEAPPGYARTAQGRAYQVKFDLLDRVYLGVAWTPTFQRKDARIAAPDGFPFTRGRVETGFSASFLSAKNRSRHDLRLLEGSVSFKDIEVQGQLLAYDYQHAHVRPSVFVSTFVGAPALHPFAFPLGFGFRLLGVEDRPPAFRSTLDVEAMEAHLAWNPLQSADLYSHLRLEAGADVGEYWQDRSTITQGLGTGAAYAGFTAAVRSRLALGEGGLHSLTLDVVYRRPTLLGGPLAGETLSRVRASVAYEGVLLAVDDQPISLRIGADGGAREDPASHVTSVDVQGSAGLRFSFWAPARVPQTLPALEDP